MLSKKEVAANELKHKKGLCEMGGCNNKAEGLGFFGVFALCRKCHKLLTKGLY